MATKGQPGKQPDGNQKGDQAEVWVPPRGIRYAFRADRPNAPFYLHWRDENGKREAMGYSDEKKREMQARSLADKREAHGSAVLTFDPVKWNRYLEFQRIVGADVDPIQVGMEWRAHRQGLGVSGAVGMTVPDAFKLYRARRAETEKLSADTWRHIDTHVGKRFCVAFASVRLNDVTAEQIRSWRNGLKHPRTGEPLDDRTKNHHRKDVNQFFEWCRMEGIILRNPCELVEVLDVDDGDIVVIRPRDAFEFFKVNRTEPVTARVAMEAFGGLRYKTAGQITKANVNFDERGIEMPGAMHKSGKRKFRQGHPAVLWSWLAVAPESTWKMTLLNHREWKRAALVRANLRPLAVDTEESKAQLRGLRNIWRHSFASYLLASTKSFDRVRYLMQHTNAATTEKYEGVATERDAKLYLAITPEAVAKLSWEEFEAKVLRTKSARRAPAPRSPVDAVVGRLAAAGR